MADVPSSELSEIKELTSTKESQAWNTDCKVALRGHSSEVKTPLRSYGGVVGLTGKCGSLCRGLCFILTPRMWSVPSVSLEGGRHTSLITHLTSSLTCPGTGGSCLCPGYNGGSDKETREPAIVLVGASLLGAKKRN